MPSQRTIDRSALAVSLALAGLAAFWFRPYLAPQRVPEAGGAEAPKPPPSPYHLEAIQQQDLFGDARRPLPTTPSARHRHPLDQLTLLGVMGDDQGQGTVIITRNGKQQAYRVGDQLDGNPLIKIEKIVNDGVILNLDGALERLPLKPPRQGDEAGRIEPIPVSPAPSSSKSDDSAIEKGADLAYTRTADNQRLIKAPGQ